MEEDRTYGLCKTKDVSNGYVVFTSKEGQSDLDRNWGVYPLGHFESVAVPPTLTLLEAWKMSVVFHCILGSSVRADNYQLHLVELETIFST